jgi:hypothetical protein
MLEKPSNPSFRANRERCLSTPVSRIEISVRKNAAKERDSPSLRSLEQRLGNGANWNAASREGHGAKTSEQDCVRIDYRDALDLGRLWSGRFKLNLANSIYSGADGQHLRLSHFHYRGAERNSKLVVDKQRLLRREWQFERSAENLRKSKSRSNVSRNSDVHPGLPELSGSIRLGIRDADGEQSGSIDYFALSIFRQCWRSGLHSDREWQQFHLRLVGTVERQQPDNFLH